MTSGAGDLRSIERGGETAQLETETPPDKSGKEKSYP